MLQHIIHKIKKCKQVGIPQAARSVHARYRQKKFSDQWRAKALSKQAQHAWLDIALSNNMPENFQDFFAKIKENFGTFPRDQFFFTYDTSALNREVIKICKKKFDLLGSGPTQLTQLAWHIDFRLRAQSPLADYTFPADQYYKDIQVASWPAHELGKDIKVPWELSRFQHLSVLGQAYQATGDMRYANTFKDHVTDWIDKNPFLLGVNWVCPMEVGLRSINWIWAFYFFKDAPLPEEFWENFVCSLYDHYVYLENNWELYDGRTSNHYLSDLVGYLYLCYFFADFSNSKARWCADRIHAEMARQVCPQGTSYEGSTQYHRLVTELFYHAYSMMRAQNTAVPAWFLERLQAMANFLGWCSTGAVTIVIGDHDSGTVLSDGIWPALMLHAGSGEQHYKQFGLSVMRVGDIHLTLRHHAYRSRQPSGHFHNDVGSITLAHKDIPLLADPGSFVYTPSVKWRNYFRSAAVHNTFFLDDEEPIPLTDELFGLAIPEACLTGNVDFAARHALYARYGLEAERIVHYVPEEKAVYLVDSWHKLGNKQVPQKNSVWNFTLDPEVTVQEKADGWHILYKQRTRAVLSSPDLQFSAYEGWCSPAYGVRERCVGLRAKAPVVCGKKISIMIMLR